MHALNFCTKAIIDIETLINEGAWGDDAGRLKLISKMLEKAEVFIMPDGGEIVDVRGDDLRNENFRPPFLVTALEFETEDEAFPKEISLCLDNSGSQEDGHLFYKLRYSKDKKKWEPHLFSLEVRPGIDALITPMVSTPNESEPKGILTSVLSHYSLYSALLCNNVNKVKIAQPEKLNLARKKSGKKPLKDFHILTLGKRENICRSDGEPQGGHRRAHLRRGHVRRLESGERTWINACFVSGKGGFVDKAYKMLKVSVPLRPFPEAETFAP